MNIPEEVERFRGAAIEYCHWAEQPPAEQDREATTAVRLLSSLLHHIQSVPGADPEDLLEHEILQKGEGTLDVYRRFGALPFQYYSEVWDPIEVPGAEPVTGDLADDLMDIYVDLRQGLRYFEQNRTVQAIFHWTFSFGVHWGRHATSALRVLHCYLVDPRRQNEA